MPVESIWPDRDKDRTPGWWRDVQRSLHSAFSQFGSCLAAIEDQLKRNPPLNHRNPLLPLAVELERSTGRLGRVLKLASTRLNDAGRMGLSQDTMEQHRAMAANASSRAIEVRARLAERMEKIENELWKRRNSQKVNQIYRIAAPSYIDLRL